MPVDGSSKIADDITESLEPFDNKDAVDFQTAYFAGFVADKYDVAEIYEALSEVQELIDAKALFTPDEYETYIEELGKNRQTVVKALCLHIAHDCNLACE